MAGNTGLKRITRWDPEVTPCHAAGEVDDFEPKDWMDFKAVRRTDKNVVFGVAAAKQALADSGLEITPDNAEDVGVIFGSGVGGPALMQDAISVLGDEGPQVGQPLLHRQHAARHGLRPDRHRDWAPRAPTCAS